MKNCRECTQNRLSGKLQRAPQRFPLDIPLEHVGMDILNRLQKMLSTNQFSLGRNDRYMKLPRPVLTSITTALHIASLFLDGWVLPYGIPEHILMARETQFISEFF